MLYDIYEVRRNKGFTLARTNDGVGFVARPAGSREPLPGCYDELVAANTSVESFDGTTIYETLGMPLGKFLLPSQLIELCVFG